MCDVTLWNAVSTVPSRDAAVPAILQLAAVFCPRSSPHWACGITPNRHINKAICVIHAECPGKELCTVSESGSACRRN